jgi:hypothetical protein
MAKKLFLKRQNAILQTEVPSVSRGLDESEIASKSRNSIRSRTTAQLPFLILNETFKSFPKYFSKKIKQLDVLYLLNLNRLVRKKNLLSILRNALHH